PDAIPIHYDKLSQSLPMDPWLLGVLLGDGGLSTHSIYLTNPDEEIVEGVRRILPPNCDLRKLRREYRYLVTGEGRGKGRINHLNLVLRDLGLLGNPHQVDGSRAHTKLIPEQFMRASLSERLALLQGLLDTDGTISKEGKVSITLNNFEMVEQIAELARSLGGWASVRMHVLRPYDQIIHGQPYHNKGGEFWQTTLDMGDLPPFRLSRKLARCRERTSPRTRAIKVVAPVGEMKTRCISVNANDHLYLSSFFIPVFNTGVKGQHEPDLIIDEAQDYPEKGWVEIHETVNKDHTGPDGESDFTYHFYGVHSGARDSGFFKSINDGAFKVTTVTAIQRPGWSKPEKDAARARYGGSDNPDYRRNIYGEPGAAASAYFVTARLMACVDQGPPNKMPEDSTYNTHEYVRQELRAEEVDELQLPMNEVLDLPGSYGKVYGGMDIGLTDSPTVISLFSHEKVRGVERLKLIRRYTLHRFRTRQIREALYAIGWHFGGSLHAFGIDVTGLGFPMWQEMEDDEAIPPRLKQVARGYFFNAKVPVSVDRDFITTDEGGRMRDQFGSVVERETDEWGVERFVTKMSMIEASTRYLREFVDKGFLMLPFDTEITTDMQGETQQRVRAIGDRPRKPNAFHILDSFRAMAMGFKAGEVEEALEIDKPQPVLDFAL
ncbi:MAG: LAGLIDADG family homing endonuclease, partial [Acidimicrobiia bacterium]|nr:LAGLIDADG family homing endonuclease [Acidimicrobiia bacterium]